MMFQADITVKDYVTSQTFDKSTKSFGPKIDGNTSVSVDRTNKKIRTSGIITLSLLIQRQIIRPRFEIYECYDSIGHKAYSVDFENGRTLSTVDFEGPDNKIRLLSK